MRQWMRGNVVAVAAAAVVATTNVSVLGVLGSNVFNISATRAPLSRDTKDLIALGGVASVLFEDLPQVRCRKNREKVGGGGKRWFVKEGIAGRMSAT